MLPDLTEVIRAVGLIGVWGIVFAESGLLIGFFFPGDSLLFTAGFLASQNVFNVYILAFGAFVAAVAGDNAGYTFGHKVGRRLFNKKDSAFFHKENLDKANDFYKKHGRKTIILARFIPIVRTFAPIVAGVGEMEYKTFFVFNIIGGALWALGVTFAGYFLGSIIPDIDKYLLPIIFLIILISVSPNLIHIAKNPNEQKQILAMAQAVWNKITKK